MKRRTFLLSAVGSGLILATGSSASAVTPVSPVQPWREAGRTTADPRIFVVEHAVLAPNPHNRQPWIVELREAGAMTLYCDLARRLPETDPFDRQIVIGLGAFIETASLAAGRLGFKLDVVPFPDGEPAPRLDERPIAHLRLVPIEGGRPDALFDSIKSRRSTKRPFDMARPVSADTASLFAALSTPAVGISTELEPARVERLRALTWDAWLAEFETKRTWMETVDLMRFGSVEIGANPDGVSIGGPGLEPLVANGTLSRTAFADQGSDANRIGRERYQTMLASTLAYLSLSTSRDDRRGQIESGRAYARANLLATSLGLVMHPVSQALQEFPEMAPHKAAVEAALGVVSPGRVQMLARLGYGPVAQETPRWEAASRIRKG